MADGGNESGARNHEDALRLLGERTGELSRIARLITVVPRSVAEGALTRSRAELLTIEYTIRAISLAPDEGFDLLDQIAVSLRRIAITLDQALYMSGINAAGGVALNTLRDALQTILETKRDGLR